MTDFTGLKATFINCSLKRDASASHTAKLLARVAAIMTAEGVEVDTIHALEHNIAFGMAKDLADQGVADDWPQLQERVMAGDIFVIGTPIWLGVKSSVATLVVERMYAASGDKNDKDQYLYYGKTAGCVVTGNEDGIKECSRDVLYAMQHIGYMIPPQADCGWIGEAGPGLSYGEVGDDGGSPSGYDNDFTNRNTTIMAWNLMHAAKMLRDAGGFPVGGNQASKWQEVSNATDFDPGPIE